jgi:hypothetical protein
VFNNTVLTGEVHAAMSVSCGRVSFLELLLTPDKMLHIFLKATAEEVHAAVSGSCGRVSCLELVNCRGCLDLGHLAQSCPTLHTLEVFPLNNNIKKIFVFNLLPLSFWKWQF